MNKLVDILLSFLDDDFDVNGGNHLEIEICKVSILVKYFG